MLSMTHGCNIQLHIHIYELNLTIALCGKGTLSPFHRVTQSTDQLTVRCQGLEFSLTELEMDFHCKEFQLCDLTKLPCSSTDVFNGITHHCNV